METEKRYVEYCRQVVQGIVRGPVEVERILDDRGVLLLIRVEPKEIGAVIGRQGETINAIRKLMKCAGAIEDDGVSVKVADEQQLERDGRRDPVKDMASDLGVTV